MKGDAQLQEQYERRFQEEISRLKNRAEGRGRRDEYRFDSLALTNNLEEVKMEKIESLKGKTIAIVGMGRSWHDYNLAKSHGIHFDEVWAINSVASVIFHDRVFMMDPPSRFLDSDDVGGQTETMRKLLQKHDKPIYSCVTDERCPP